MAHIVGGDLGGTMAADIDPPFRQERGGVRLGLDFIRVLVDGAEITAMGR